ncbi:hypothetical protein HFP15_09980 [Amycolatopsis sp. K13G38]|uniref:Uncharacterized protein n=1 Tax=Amycolatopsis acididurans TaxID=2724524 RepID=A0ABX1J4G5_9PSEU|nr:hypothetical protein [Amycolatopsis acididurans]NKQ53210.1 hypothetical protein [Amycolatopsis acididurans]
MSAVILLLVFITLFTETRAPGYLVLLEFGVLIPCIAVDLAVLFGPRRREVGDLLAPLRSDHRDEVSADTHDH